jgi:Ni/Fe-hydrogenase 1 B-type cytochrome subunit
MALHAEGGQEGSLARTLFGWVHSLIWTSARLHRRHHLGMWWIVIFMIAHIYVAICEDIMSRPSIVSTMISGTRTFKDDRPD